MIFHYRAPPSGRAWASASFSNRTLSKISKKGCWSACWRIGHRPLPGFAYITPGGATLQRASPHSYRSPVQWRKGISGGGRTSHLASNRAYRSAQLSSCGLYLSAPQAGQDRQSKTRRNEMIAFARCYISDGHSSSFSLGRRLGLTGPSAKSVPAGP